MALIAIALIALVVAPMLTMRPADLATLRDRWGVVAIVIGAVSLVAVLALLGLGALTPGSGAEEALPSAQFGAAMLILIAPVGLAAPLLAGLTGGNVMLARALVPASMVPPLLLAGPVFFGSTPSVLALLVAVLLIPAAVVLLRPGLGTRLSGPASTLPSVVTLVLAGVVIWQTGLAGLGAGLLTAVIVLVVLLLAGWVTGAVLRLDASDRRAVVLAATTRHLGLPLGIALAMDAPEMGVPVIDYAILMWAAGLAPLALRRRA